MDPLSALRDFTVRAELDAIARVRDEFRFASDYSFPCSAETAYRSKQGNLYTLETLLFYIKNHSLKHTDYLQLARTQRVPTVTLPDRKPLLDYLSGKVSSSDAIELLVSSAAEYRPDDPVPDLADPDRDLDPADDPDPISLIRAAERPLKDREALLECKHRDFYGVLVASTRREEERQRVESQQRKDGLVAKSRLMGSDERGLGFGDDLGFDSTPKPKMHLKGSKIGEGVPIILVPSAFQTLITIYNVKEFLEDGVYIPTDVKVKQMKGPKPDCVTVQKNN